MLPGTETILLNRPGEKCVTQDGTSLEIGDPKGGIVGSLSVQPVPTRPTTGVVMVVHGEY